MISQKLSALPYIAETFNSRKMNARLNRRDLPHPVKAVMLILVT